MGKTFLLDLGKMKTEGKKSFWDKKLLEIAENIFLEFSLITRCIFQLSIFQKQMPFWKIFLCYQVCISSSFFFAKLQSHSYNRKEITAVCVLTVRDNCKLDDRRLIRWDIA